MKIGLFQLNTSYEKVEENISYMDMTMSSRSADLYICPELFNTGYELEEVSVRADNAESVFSRVAELAVKHKAWIIPGSMAVKKNGKVYNSMHVIDPAGCEAGTYDKVHLFSLTGEENYFAPGKGTVTVKAAGMVLGLTICYDLRFPEIFRKYRSEGAQLFVNVANWPAARVDHWKLLGQTRAVENSCFMLGVNRTGSDSGLSFPGSSYCYGPDGGEMLIMEKGMKYGEVDIALKGIYEQREKLDSFIDRRNDIY